MGRRKVLDILQAAAADLGAEIKHECGGLIVIIYEQVGYFLLIDERRRIFCLYHAVKGANGELTESEFDTVLDLVRGFYPNCSGYRNDGYSFVHSPWYRVVADRKEISGNLLGKIIDRFMKMWYCACSKAYLLTNKAVCGDNK